ncbi:MAG: chemotaxis protein CheW [Planctomycetota bacterium]
MRDRETFCTFSVGDLYFGVPVTRVQEVIRHQPTTQVPLAPEVIHGLMNLRGQIVPAIDLRTRLGIEPRDDETRPINVVIRTSDEPISLLVDEIGDVVKVDILDFEPPPETLSAAQRELIEGTYKLETRLLLVLDTEEVVQVSV